MAFLFDATRRGVLVKTTTSTRHSAHAWATVRHLDEVITLIDAER
ncbi:hypothetical protein ACGFX2_34945 [Streptomyces goshikiensis]